MSERGPSAVLRHGHGAEFSELGELVAPRLPDASRRSSEVVGVRAPERAKLRHLVPVTKPAAPSSGAAGVAGGRQQGVGPQGV